MLREAAAHGARVAGMPVEADVGGLAQGALVEAESDDLTCG